MNFNLVANIRDLESWGYAILRAYIAVRKKQDAENRKNIIKKVENYICRNIEKDLDLRSIAEFACIHHPNYLSSLFKAEIGTTLIAYITRKKMERAKFLLRLPGVKVYEVADLVGYKSFAYFSRLFKKIVGMSPKKYQDDPT